MAITEDTISYFMEAYECNILSEEHEALVNDTTVAPSHVGSRMQYVIKCRLRNVLLWAFVLLLLPGAVASDTGLAGETDFLTVTVITILSLLASTLFLLGRWSRMDWVPHQKVLCVDATNQTEDTTVSGRLRAEIEEWKFRTLEAEGTAMENGKALKLAIANMEYVGELTNRAGNVLRRCLREMDAHRLECPLYVGIFISRHGRKLHVSQSCSSLEGRDPKNVDHYCESEPHLPCQPPGLEARKRVERWHF